MSSPAVRWDVGDPANAIDPNVAPPSVPFFLDKWKRMKLDGNWYFWVAILTCNATKSHESYEKSQRRTVEPLTAAIFARPIRRWPVNVWKELEFGTQAVERILSESFVASLSQFATCWASKSPSGEWETQCETKREVNVRWGEHFEACEIWNFNCGMFLC